MHTLCHSLPRCKCIYILHFTFCSQFDVKMLFPIFWFHKFGRCVCLSEINGQLLSHKSARMSIYAFFRSGFCVLFASLFWFHFEFCIRIEMAARTCSDFMQTIAAGARVNAHFVDRTACSLKLAVNILKLSNLYVLWSMDFVVCVWVGTVAIISEEWKRRHILHKCAHKSGTHLTHNVIIVGPLNGIYTLLARMHALPPTFNPKPTCTKGKKERDRAIVCERRE